MEFLLGAGCVTSNILLDFGRDPKPRCKYRNF